MWHWRTTGNSNVAIQTGSTSTVWHISLQFRRQTWGFRPGRAGRKCQQVTITTTGSSDIAPKPEIVTPLELQQIASKFQRQVRDFRPWRARIKCRQVIATMTDNRKWQCGHQNWKYLYLSNYDRQDDNSNGKPGVLDHAQREETDPGRLRQRPTDNRKWQYRRFWRQSCNFFGSRSLSQSFG